MKAAIMGVFGDSSGRLPSYFEIPRLRIEYTPIGYIYIFDLLRLYDHFHYV